MAFDEAAGDDEALGAAGLLELGHFEDSVDGLLLGRVDKGAGVDHDDVRVFRVGGKLMPFGDEIAHHDFRVDEILGAAETNKTYFQSRFQFSSLSVWLDLNWERCKV